MLLTPRCHRQSSPSRRPTVNSLAGARRAAKPYAETSARTLRVTAVDGATSGRRRVVVGLTRAEAATGLQDKAVASRAGSGRARATSRVAPCSAGLGCCGGRKVSSPAGAVLPGGRPDPASLVLSSEDQFWRPPATGHPI